MGGGLAFSEFSHLVLFGVLGMNLLHSATVTLASAGRGAHPKRKLTAVARESWTIESSSSRRQQPNSERRTRSSTHTVNLPLLPAETANDAYGPQNSG